MQANTPCCMMQRRHGLCLQTPCKALHHPKQPWHVLVHAYANTWHVGAWWWGGAPLTSNAAPFDTLVLTKATGASTLGLWLAHGYMWCCTRAMHSLLLEIGKWVACISKKQLNGCYCSSTRLYRHTQPVWTCIWGMAGHTLPKLSHGHPSGPRMPC